MNPSSPLKPLWQRHKQINIGCIGLSLLWLFCLTVIVSLLFIHFASKGHVNFIPKQQSKQRNIITKLKHGYAHFDLFDGCRVPVSNGSLYSRQSDPTIPESKNCGKNGKENAEYLNWGWESFRCELERFEAKTFLRIVRGKTLAFIGDSVARNQMESLLCLLSQEQTPINKYKDSDNHFAEWYFPSHNFTVKALWMKFFVMGKEVVNGTHIRVCDIHLDKLDKNWTHEFPSTDIAIISNAHWFFPPMYLCKCGVLTGCVYCNAANIRNIRPVCAFQKTFQLALKHVCNCKECGNLLTFPMASSPALFDNRGNRTKPYKPEQLNIRDTASEIMSIQTHEVKKAAKNRRQRFWDFRCHEDYGNEA